MIAPISPSSQTVARNSPSKLKIDKHFLPYSTGTGDELFVVGIFEFNISRLLAFIDAHPQRFSVEWVEVAEIARYGKEPRDKEAIRTANLTRPIVLAEIAPDRYNLVDGHHRLARARREGVQVLPAWRIHCPEHTAFLTSVKAYEVYVGYWNGKVKELQRRS